MFSVSKQIMRSHVLLCTRTKIIIITFARDFCQQNSKNAAF